jgi:DNA-directed RNA polymerase subunit F
MIKNSQPLSMPEVKKLLSGIEDNERKKQLEVFIKKFSKIQIKKALDLKKELEGLNMIKLKPEYIVKIIDALPEDTPDLNKIFIDVSLDEDETNKILETVKKYK